MKLLFSALLVALAVFPATASARRAGLEHSEASLIACDTDAHTATFRGNMAQTRKAKQQLQMRFVIQTRKPGGTWTKVQAPALWVTAQPGKTLYIYDKQLEALSVGASYRAVIHFRWRSPRTKRALARATRATPGCRQPDLRPNLRPVKVLVTDGSSPSTRFYDVTVVNTGEGDTAVTSVGLLVDGLRLADQADPGIVSGDRTVVSFEGPPCVPGDQLVALVDTTQVVDEADEADNALSLLCPES